jgi:hypothetical protein
MTMALYVCSVRSKAGDIVMAGHWKAADVQAARELARAEFEKPTPAELVAIAPENAAKQDAVRAALIAEGYEVVARRSKAKDADAWAMN